jgi:hypothetical protein
VGRYIQHVFRVGEIFSDLWFPKIYEIFKPTSILDFTMGWGGRMVGAMALNVKNTRIQQQESTKPYKEIWLSY